MSQIREILNKIIDPIKNRKHCNIVNNERYLTIEEVIKRYEELSAR